jgi:hypothetical protein
MTVLVEANKFTRNSAKNEHDEKVRAWANATPPTYITGSRYDNDVMALEHAKFLMNGSLVLRNDREYVPLKARDDFEPSGGEYDETDAWTVSDDSS